MKKKNDFAEKNSTDEVRIRKTYESFNSLTLVVQLINSAGVVPKMI